MTRSRGTEEVRARIVEASIEQLSAPDADLGDYAPTFMIVATGATAFLPTEPQA